MIKLSKLEMEEIISSSRNLYESKKYLRRGQSYMIALHSIRPDVYKYITDTGKGTIDCFYDDRLVDNFLNFLKSNTIE